MKYQEVVKQHKTYFNSNVTRNIKWRKQQLLQIKKLVITHEEELLKALRQDLNKPEQESWITELSYITGDVDHTIKSLKSWSKPTKVSTPIVTQPGKSYILPEPQGTVLIMGAWNYPVQLILAPLVAVIAAGNCAVIKPSELAPNTSSLLARLIPEYLDTDAFSVVEGGVQETTDLLELAFDHIMYTGNGQVARIVMRAAAKHLTPVTLELGGKSPVFIDSSANLKITAERLAWGKWMNAGQTCIAPDYVLITEDMVEPLISELKHQVIKMFGKDSKTSDSYGRIVNERHTQRLQSYLADHDVVFGGDVDVQQKFISPTIVHNPSLDSQLMQEEIFGPILPIVVVKDFASAKQLVVAREKPLAAYIFTKNSQQQAQWTAEISAGSQCINDVIMFNAVPDLPFGGTGPSGMGQYSGKSGFDNFSHAKAILKRPFIKDLPVRFAPYSKSKFKLLRFIR